jgi:hypothetical protein
MSHYLAGLSFLGAGATNAPIVDIASPGNIRDEIATIAFQFKALDQQVQARRAKLPADYLQGWALFLAEWQAFATNHASWTDNLFYKSYAKALEYRQRLEEWRAKLVELTGQAVNYPNAGPGQKPAATPSIPWKPIIYGAVAIGGLWALARLFGSASELKREFTGSSAGRLQAPADMVTNPPPWARDPELWEQARIAVQPYAGRYDNPQAVTTHVYKQLGGRVG